MCEMLRCVVASAFLLAAIPAGAFTVLVTNDDGVGAPGLDAVVGVLSSNPALDVVVVAPLNNASGSGDSTTSTPMAVTATTTASGRPATAVDGFPADSVLVAIHHLLPEPPDLVVSGINFGQNVTREVSDISGTVGAALTAARAGIPAIAVSQAFIPSSYLDAAVYTGNLVERIRRTRSFQRRLQSRDRPGVAKVLSVNWPSCSVGRARGARLTGLGFLSSVTGYTTPNPGEVQETRVTRNFAQAQDCQSTDGDVADDLDALVKGFASVVVLNADNTSGDARNTTFRFVERIPF